MSSLSARQSALLLISSLALATPVNAQEIDTTSQAEPETLGLNHIGFAVSDLDASAAFFIKTLGWRRAGGNPDYPAIFVASKNMFVTLWQTQSGDETVAFNRRTNVGLHHMAITVRDLPTLHDLHRRFEAHDRVTVEFAPEFLSGGPATHMMIREPSGLRLEFIVPANRMPKTVTAPKE